MIMNNDHNQLFIKKEELSFQSVKQYKVNVPDELAKVDLVINYDLPAKHDNRTEPDCEVYLHRIGRAGRFGCKGAVFNLLCGDSDETIMSKIENHFGTKVAEVHDWRSEENFKAALRSAGLL